MARITGKNATLFGVLARTSVSVAANMTDSGDQKTYSLIVTAVTRKYWNPNKPPIVTKQALGAGPFVVVAANLYTVDFINGLVTFGTANNVADVVAINGIEYMSLQQLGDLFNWSIDMKLATVDTTAFQDQFTQRISSIRSWTATASGYYVSSYWFDLFTAQTGTTNPEVYVVFYPDASSNERFIGAGTVNWTIDTKKDAAVTEKMTIDGTGDIARLTTTP